MEATQDHASVHSEEEHAHPDTREYVQIAIILAVVTAIEVFIYYIRSLKPVLIPLLMLLAIIKFSMVAMWFMHLKFDNKIFRRLFILGIILALAVFTAAFLTFLTAVRVPTA
jgi:cytochrome c oxidase subunit IV